MLDEVGFFNSTKTCACVCVGLSDCYKSFMNLWMKWNSSCLCQVFVHIVLTSRFAVYRHL